MKNKKNKSFLEEFDSLFNNIFDSNYDTEDLSTRTDGKLDITKGEDENGKWEKQLWVSDDGLVKISTFSRTSDSFEEHSLNQKSIKEADLRKQLKSAVESEDFRSAAKIKEEIDSLNNNV